MSGPLSPCLPQPGPCTLGFPITPAPSDATLEAGLIAYLTANTAVNALLGGRIYPGFAERGVGQFPVLVYEVSEVEHINSLSGSAGMARATIELDCWSSVYGDVVTLAETLRRALQGFKHGWWGCVGIASVIPQGQDEDSEPPQDDSGTWWYRRGLSYSVLFYEPIPTF